MCHRFPTCIVAMVVPAGAGFLQQSSTSLPSRKHAPRVVRTADEELQQNANHNEGRRAPIRAKATPLVQAKKLCGCHSTPESPRRGAAGAGGTASTKPCSSIAPRGRTHRACSTGIRRQRGSADKTLSSNRCCSRSSSCLCSCAPAHVTPQVFTWSAYVCCYSYGH